MMTSMPSILHTVFVFSASQLNLNIFYIQRRRRSGSAQRTGMCLCMFACEHALPSERRPHASRTRYESVHLHFIRFAC